MISEAINFEGGGSGKGVSYYAEILECPRRARLKADTSGLRSSYDADVGTAFHRLAELHHSRITDVVLEVADPADEDRIQEGQRLFQGYSSRFDPDFWGEVLGTEVHLPGECEEDCPAAAMENKTTCRCDRFTRETTLRELWQVDFTMRIDMVTMLKEELQYEVRLTPEYTHTFTASPGIYLLDFKTSKQRSSAKENLYQWRPQFHAYMSSWNTLFSQYQAKGMIVVQCIRHKALTDKSYVPILVPFDTAGLQERRVKTMLNMAKTLEGTDAPFTGSACEDWGGCRFLGKECDGT